MPVEEYIARLKAHGHRITPKVRAVIELFLERQSVLDPFEVQAWLKKKYKGVGLPTVYRILEKLEERGIPRVPVETPAPPGFAPLERKCLPESL